MATIRFLYYGYIPSTSLYAIITIYHMIYFYIGIDIEHLYDEIYVYDTNVCICTAVNENVFRQDPIAFKAPVNKSVCTRKTHLYFDSVE